MANKSVFATLAEKILPKTDAVNHEGSPAYSLSAKEALAQMAVTGTFNATFYADAHTQLETVLDLARQTDAEFLAKTAVYAYEKGYMKDMPALLLAVLSGMPDSAFVRAFPRIVTNGKMLRNFVQIVRSGATGRSSLGTRPKRMVREWLDSAGYIALMRAAVGNDPSLADVVKMVHPKPKDAVRTAFYAWLIGKPYDVAALPEIVRAFENFKRDPSLPVPEVPFQMLTSLPLEKEHWVQIAEKAGWQMLRQNLNTFARNGVFEVPGFAKSLAARLRDADEIAKARVFPYQLMVAFVMADEKVPSIVRNALQDAMECALVNVPVVEGNVVICPDVSGSMSSPVTGWRKGATTAVRCIDAAALVAAAFLRRNKAARVLPFENNVVKLDLNARDSVMTNAARLASIGGGGTNCSAPLKKLADEKARVDLVVFVSDNESWVDARPHGQGTSMMQQWKRLKKINPDARMVCIDIQPYTTTQAKSNQDILNVGGFSDTVFETITTFARGNNDPAHWISTIESVEV